MLGYSYALGYTAEACYSAILLCSAILRAQCARVQHKTSTNDGYATIALHANRFVRRHREL